MASKTITLKAQRINAFGPSPSTRWGNTGPYGTMSWGSSTWGQKSAGAGGLPTLLRLLNYNRTWSGSNQLHVSNTSASLFKTINVVTKLGSPSLVYQISNKALLTGNGYYYVFNDRTTNLESATAGSFLSMTAGVTASTGNYTSQTVQTTIWS